jgi:hypothetical protein
MGFDEALELVSSDDRFKATIYAMNTLLIHKGIYTQREFEVLFIEWVAKRVGRHARRVEQGSSTSLTPA